MTIEDAVGILHGQDTAATGYLRGKSYDSLQMAFTPIVQTALDKPIFLNTSTEVLYTKLINTYNTASLGGVLFAEITKNTLSEYVTTRAFNVLFIKVAEEEKLIRKVPLHRVSDILEKVFSELDS